MLSAGVDMGSLTTSAVICNNNKVLASYIRTTGADAEKAGTEALNEACREADLKIEEIEEIVATGYGRVNLPQADRQVTEITCHGRGARKLNSQTGTVIDIGGQDSKVIRLDGSGMVVDFEMNDKCAAGTGRFLEVMAEALEVELEELEELSARARNHVNISSMCAVFAESEVVSKVAEGHPREDIIKGIHKSIAERISAMAARVGMVETIMMTGGVAKNSGVVKCLEDELEVNIEVPDDPQIAGALGAALLAADDQKEAVGG
ncbi:acyl-CoA dehydratase activase [Halarsenatibacter silvermanii]|uniref:Benzoyl-CoA reductase, bcr type, subunit A/benzoyl-CoA reductase, bcr type, subunit D,TIGR02261 n=1 Tax=Halarsenatibacter silvermanii TaxID=321763 RepID=A0A1G9KJ59_9FIRM|nr:acyl-CoA dehydratase activase [Halarsenatibacter silvermanii]SDL49537.1 benzoyl-CoA reductase, bcr type, subunit A/benzoyl-CoA reductase, bcr type, subunit D,TIGR02261 [Halarsenatibacter silvermanii]